MALHLQTLRTRSLTAVVFVVVMLAGLLWNFWSFLILFTIIHFGCWIEYLKLVEKIYNISIDNVIKYFFAVCGITLMFVFGIQDRSYNAGLVIAGTAISFKLLFWLLLFICLLIFIVQNKQVPVKAKQMSFLGFLYISLSFTLLLDIRSNPLVDLGKIITCAIIFSIWINDTMAYIVGSLIGKTPFSKISPKKTWEGTSGGAILCIAVISVLGYYIPVAQSISVRHWVAIAAICAVFGTLGDLLESKLKRMANVKDSGSIMPGHGGFLDRFDSLLVATPFVWLYLYLFL
jgi:phosphatidate cytidylyltransferase